jgi:hypothetical protein
MTASAQSSSLTADEIMARVADNQDRAEQLRAQYIYRQHAHITTRKFNGKLMREETADYTVLPGATGTEKQLLALTGRYWHKDRYLDFRGEPTPETDSLDGDLVHDFREDLCGEKSKDGIGRDLFPLTSTEVKKYRFRLLGERIVGGRATYRIAFRPADSREIAWAGEALIDKAELQPVSVYTKLSRRIPFAVRTLLGTDLPGVGFSVQYARQEQGVWFPVSFGTEFRLHVIFFINRQITVALQNTDFERTHVNSRIASWNVLDALEPAPTPPPDAPRFYFLPGSAPYRPILNFSSR